MKSFQFNIILREILQNRSSRFRDEMIIFKEDYNNGLIIEKNSHLMKIFSVPDLHGLYSPTSPVGHATHIDVNIECS